MAKRVYKQSIIKWLIEYCKKHPYAIGVTSTTLVGSIFLYLSIIGAITINGHSGDTTCLGTEEDPCYAYINFTAHEDIFIYPTGYDPWGRDTMFEFHPNVKSWKLQRSWGSGWRNIPLDKSCTGTWCGLSNADDTRKFSIAFREGRDYQIRIVAYKNDPKDEIKWGAFDGEVDPIWYGPSDWIIEGNSVYIDDNRTFINITPYKQHSGYVYVEAELKNHTGDVTALVGVPDDDIILKDFEYWNPHNESINNTYVCTDEFNYTTSPKYAWCYDLNGTVIFEHSFDSGNIPTKTIWWTTLEEDNYSRVPGDYSVFDYDYDNQTKWYAVENIPMVAGVKRKSRFRIVTPVIRLGEKTDKYDSKYDFGFMPSSYDVNPAGLAQAIADDNLYYIDPWTEGTTGLVAYWTMDNADTDGTKMIDFQATHNGTNQGADTGQAGIVNEAYFFDEENTDWVNLSTLWTFSPQNFSYTLWVKFEVLTPQIFINTPMGQLRQHNTFKNLTFLHSQDEDGSPNFDTVNSNIELTAGVWTHIGATYNNVTGEMILYINGTDVSVSQVQEGGSAVFNSAVLGVNGRTNGAFSSYFNGTMDEAGIFNRVLSPDEMAYRWNSGAPVEGEQTPPFEVTPEDTCTYDAGNWFIQASDYCNITSAVDMGGNNITINGTGKVTITKNITNMGKSVDIIGDDPNPLEVTCIGGCFKYE